MTTYDYTTPAQREAFCNNCNEICSRHCAVYRQAEIKRDEDEKNRSVLAERIYNFLPCYEREETVEEIAEDLNDKNFLQETIKYLLDYIEEVK